MSRFSARRSAGAHERAHVPVILHPYKRLPSGSSRKRSRRFHTARSRALTRPHGFRTGAVHHSAFLVSGVHPGCDSPGACLISPCGKQESIRRHCPRRNRASSEPFRHTGQKRCSGGARSVPARFERKKQRRWRLGPLYSTQSNRFIYARDAPESLHPVQASKIDRPSGAPSNASGPDGH